MALREVMYIFYAVNAIRKIQHIKPPIVKVYQYLKRLDKNLEEAHFKSTLESFVKMVILQCKEKVKSFKDNLEHYKQCTPEDNTRTEITEL